LLAIGKLAPDITTAFGSNGTLQRPVPHERSRIRFSLWDASSRRGPRRRPRCRFHPDTATVSVSV